MSTAWGQQNKYGDYEVVGAREGRARLLGEGSFGKTFVGVRSDSVAGGVIKEYVAIKVLNPDFLRGQDKRFQFVQELLALTKFKHSNLIHYIRCGEEKGEVYYAMELCRGGDLMRLVRRFGRLPEKAAALIALQVATGLREVHQRHRLVHRDIKPSNIMLVDELGSEVGVGHLAYRFEQQDSLCRVVDFGLVSFAMNAEEKPQRFVGSPMYASPEQICEQPLDGRCDIYSLGMTLWYLLQGKGPLLDEAGAEIKSSRAAIVRHTAERPHDEDLPGRLSPEFRAILRRMVAKRPEQRFLNAAELQTALRKYLSTALENDAVEDEEPPLPGKVEVIRIAGPLESAYDLEQKLGTSGTHGAYAAREKAGGRQVKVSVVANVEGQAGMEGVSAVVERLCRLADLSMQSDLPGTLLPVRAVVWAKDLLVYTEEMVPHVVLSDVLRKRRNANRTIGLSEGVSVLRPIAEGLDFMLAHGRDAVSLSCEEVWLTAVGVGSAEEERLLLEPLAEWKGLQVRFSMMYLPQEPGENEEFGATESMAGQTLSSSVQMSVNDMHPAPAFARLVYRILNGSEVAAAVKFVPDAYVPAVTLSPASNNLIRDLISRRKEWTTAGEVLRELCTNEGVLLRASTGLPVAEVLGLGLVHSPFASAGSTQQLSWDLWTPGGEFKCEQTGQRVLLPVNLPSWEVDESTGGSNAATLPLAQTTAPLEAPTRVSLAPESVRRRAIEHPVVVATSMPPPLPPPEQRREAIGKSSPEAPSSDRKWEEVSKVARQNAKWVSAGVVTVVALFLALAWHLLAPSTSRHASSTTPAPASRLSTPHGTSAFEGGQAGEARLIAGIPFRWCPPTGPQGYPMGSPPNEVGRNKDETQHRVVLTRGFWLAETELTQRQWQQVMGTDLRAQAAKGLDDNSQYPFSPGNNQTVRDYLGVSWGDAEKVIGIEAPDAAMYWVNWPDAVNFCQSLTDHERGSGGLPGGWQFCLPTEAQWEYACRAGTTAATYDGDLDLVGQNNAPILDAIAWYGGNSGVGYQGRGFDVSAWTEKQYPQTTTAGPRVVGQKKANPWGFRDILGNVMEWCVDWREPFSSEPAIDPAGPQSGAFRALRGGAWYTTASVCRSAARMGNSPGTRGRMMGFRLAVVPQPLPIPLASAAPSLPSMEGSPKTFEGRTAGDLKWVGGIPFRWCPATGAQGFPIGSPPSEEGRGNDEVQHLVVLTHGFWTAETECTQEQWQAVMGSNLRVQGAKALADDAQYNFGGKQATTREFMRANRSEIEKVLGIEGPGMPIYWVDWNEAQDFGARLTERERASGKVPLGWRFALPSEAQWEYAARSGTSSETYAGNFVTVGANNAPILDLIGWYGGNSGFGYAGRGWNSSGWIEKQYPHSNAGPRAVGQKRASAWGLRDMIGNLWEWCDDYYGPYPSGLMRDPIGPTTGVYRVYRGGGWVTMARGCRASVRICDRPGMRSNYVGFRPVIVYRGD